MGSEIKRLGEDSIRRIVAEQAITDLSSVVKELVDNALDAESTLIKIRLFGQGLNIIEVSDDGSGVPVPSRPYLATRYATSKISSFDDIYSGTGLTMGFRGEALFSLACLSEKLVIATRTEDDEMAQKLEFRRDGSLDPDSVESIHRKVGTTVAVVQPFAAVPARKADLERRIRAERVKLFRLMESYAIFNVGVQLNLIDITSSGREDLALATSASSTKIEETVSSVLGHKFLETLTSIELDLGKILDRGENIYNWGITGLISKDPRGTPPGRAVNYYCINGRVVELPKVTTMLRKIWNSFGGKKKPSCILCLTLPNDVFDINLSPDKQQVLLVEENKLFQILEEQVNQLWSSQTNGVFQVQQVEVPDVDLEDDSEDVERQMHKRRFAFVHDLSKAKMQHDLEERKKCMDTEEKKREDCDMQEATEAQANPTEGPSSKKAKIVSREELREDASSVVAGDGSLVEKTDRESVDRVSDMHRRLWTEFQLRFNRESKVSVQYSPSAPVTPDDMTTDHPALPVTKVQQSRISECPNLDRTESNKHAQSSSTRKCNLVSLQQFAYQPNDPSTASRQRRDRLDKMDDENSSSNRNQSESDLVRTKVHLAKTDVVSVSTTDRVAGLPQRSSSKPRAAVQNDVAQSSSESTTHHDPTDATEQTNSQQTSSAVETEPEQVNVQSPKCSRSERVVWHSFLGTQEVCRDARIERFAMKNRKLEVRKTSCSHGTSRTSHDGSESKQLIVEESKKGAVINLPKSEFRHGMQIIGQFNMGFILARCSNNHLWILDQHACDEKYNFENLCRNTVLHEQNLLKPMPLELSPAEEACILDNMNIFQANGFRFDFDPDAPSRQRLRLTALPHSGAQDGRKAVQFGKDDVRALCSILLDGSSYDAGDGGTGVDGSGSQGNNAVRRYASVASGSSNTADRIIARLPKAIAMFASRACRTSIMIGTALSPKEMEKIVRHLADVEHPWNCPHGRPTMRHVRDLSEILLNDERNVADHVTGPTLTVTPMTQEPSSD